MPHTEAPVAEGCLLCGRPSDRIIWRESGYAAAACECGIVFTTPRPAGDPDEHQDIYHPDSFFSLSAGLKVRWLETHFRKGRLLEVGCSNGSFLAEARKDGFDVAGLEPHPDRVRYVRETLQIPVTEAYLEDDRVPHGTFDIVYHCDLLSHFPDPIGALRTMSSLLRPGGALFFEVGLLGGVSPLWYRMIGSIGLKHHIWLYSMAGMRTLLERADLKILKLKRFGLAPCVLVSPFLHILAKLRCAVRHDRVLGSSNSAYREAAPAWADAQERYTTFWRYRVGAYAPAIGPQTLLILAVPKGSRDAAAA